MGPNEASQLQLSGQATPRPKGPKGRQAGSRYRRLCLLKGCEVWFEPRHPLARYCSAGCRVKARHWQEWKSRQRYRASEKGKGARREQSRRRRERLKERGSARGLEEELDAERSASPTALEEPEAAVEPRDGPSTSGVGHQKRTPAGFFSCDRPGCYELRRRDSRAVLARFCTAACRNALRAVRRREARFLRDLRRRVGATSRGWWDLGAHGALYGRIDGPALWSLPP